MSAAFNKQRTASLTRECIPDTVSDYFSNRGSLGVLILLKSEPERFTDIADALHISTSTLTHRLGEARDLRFVVPEIEEKQTSVNDLYRLTERGQFVVSKLERLDVVHAYKTLLDAHDTIETSRSELIDGWKTKMYKRNWRDRARPTHTLIRSVMM